MVDILKDFRKFSLGRGVSQGVLDSFEKAVDVYPGVIEERSSAMRAVEMNVFSRLMADRLIYFSGDVTQESCDIVIAQLLYLDSVKPGMDIEMYINSHGGDVIAGLGLVDTMDFISSNVNTTCVGMAASMGAVLLSNGAKGHRYILKHGRVMIHSVSSGMQGHSKELEISFEQTMRCQKDVYEILAKNTGKTYDEICTLCDRDNWFIGQEALNLGIVDKVLEK